MNKKFSTLVASALLASGMFSTANAIDLTTAEAGQYYKLKRTAQYASGSWVNENSGWCIVNNNGTFQLSNSFDEEDSYWTVEKRTTTAGVIEVRLKNVTTGKYLDLGNTEKYFTGAYIAAGNNLWGTSTSADADANTLQWGSGNYVAISSSPWNIEGGTVAGGEYLLAIDAVPVRLSYDVKDINAKLGNGFGMQFGYLKDNKFKEYTLKGAEAFNGKLIATDKMDGSTATVTATQFHIFNSSAKKYVVLLKDKWSNNGTDLLTGDAKGFKFALMTAKQIEADKVSTDPKIISKEFEVVETLHATGNRLEVVAVDAYGVTPFDAELFVAEVDGTNYLTTNAATVVGGTPQDGQADQIASYMGKTWVRFGMTNNIKIEDFYGYAVTVKGISGDRKGKTINPADDSEWVNTNYVALTKPEGQWIATTDKNGNDTWTNRETGEEATSFFTALRLVEDNVYADADGDQYELNLTDKLGGETFEYFGEYKANNVAAGDLHSYKIAFNNKTSEEVNYVGMNGKGEVILTNDVNKAIVFDMHKVALTNDLDNNGSVKENTLVDEFNIINNAMIKNDDNKWVYTENADTVSFYRYQFVYGGKYLAYDDDEKLTLVKDDEDFFVVKEKDGNVVNVLNVGDEDYDLSSGTQVYNPSLWKSGRKLLAEDAKMLYFDNNHALLKQQTNIYNWEANAQLAIDDKTVIEYRTLAAHDTLEFYRTEYSDEFLFEHGEFLGMTYNRDKYNPAIFVDTAYVRYGTAKPMYMLAVGVNKTDASMVCPICGKSDCEHAEQVPGMISARYLVSLTDSVAAHAVELNNKFYYTGTKMTKLGFIPAVHNVDSLFIPFKDTKNGYTHWTLGYGVAPVTFAFRIVNADTQDFIIETGRLADETKPVSNANWYKTAWVKWHNGCPVLTDDMAEAEVFNVRETSETPTANDEINASEVSIIAGNGTVTIKGAAGKTVAISNVLGQTIANTVITSDEATIAAPAGVVVVAVEGEAAVKAIVK